MAKPVCVTAWIAIDGTHFRTEAEADAYSATILLNERKQNIADLLEEKFYRNDFASLSDSVTPFNREIYIDQNIAYKRDRLKSEFADFLIDNWEKLKDIVEAE